MNQTAFFVGEAGVVMRDAAWSTHYEHDNLARATTEASPDPNGTGAYDSMGRLTGITHAPSASPSIAYGYAYDAEGNRTAKFLDTSPGGTLSLGDTDVTLDADGQAGAGQEAVSFAAYAGDVRTLEIAGPNDKIVIDSLRGPIGFLGQVVQRNFYGNGVDEILAVDRVTWNGTTRTTSTF